jgi:hypothetical protein
MKTAEEILEEMYYAGDPDTMGQHAAMIKAMEEYASQFKLPDFPEAITEELKEKFISILKAENGAQYLTYDDAWASLLPAIQEVIAAEKRKSNAKLTLLKAAKKGQENTLDAAQEAIYDYARIITAKDAEIQALKDFCDKEIFNQTQLANSRTLEIVDLKKKLEERTGPEWDEEFPPNNGYYCCRVTEKTGPQFTYARLYFNEALKRWEWEGGSPVQLYRNGLLLIIGDMLTVGDG